MSTTAAASTTADHSVTDHLPETPDSALGIWLYIGLGVVLLFIFVRGWVSIGEVATDVVRPMLGFVAVCILAVALASGTFSGAAATVMALIAAGTAASFILNGRPG